MSATASAVTRRAVMALLSLHALLDAAPQAAPEEPTASK
jgi:hypothetical protein